MIPSALDVVHLMRRLVACALGCLLLLGSASAQERSGSLTGTVTDPTGGALPGASVTITPRLPGSSRSTTTDAEGRYRLDGVTPGEYVVRAVLAGFGTRDGETTVLASAVATLDLSLEVSLAETVTVTRGAQAPATVPQAVAVIGADTIQAFQRRASPAEAFMGVPGFYVENRRNYSLSGGVRFAIRAPLPRFGMRGVQILQDGVPMTMADGTTEPTNIDLGSLGRVEVLRGPSSVLYGNSAGGVISLESEFPASGLIAVQPDVQVGSFGYQQQQLKVSGAAGRIGYLANVTRLETDGYRDHSRSEVRRGNVVVRAALSERTELRGVVNVYDLPFGESASTVTLADARSNPTSARPQAFTQGWGESTTQAQTGVTLQHRFAPGHVLRVTGWGLGRDVWNPVPNSVVSVERTAGGVRSEYAGARQIGRLPLTWTTGFDLSLQHDERAEYDNLGVPAAGGRTQIGALRLQQLEEVRSLSPFVLFGAQVAPRWTVNAGARYDRYRFTATDRFVSNGDQSGGRTLAAVSPMAGVTFVASPWLNVYANLATAYQTPTTVELSNRPTDEGGFNEDLDPERTVSGEIGVRGALPAWRVRFEVAGYVSRLARALVQFQRADERVYFRNAGEANRRGLETLIEWAPTSRLKARASYTFQHFRFGDFVAPEGDFSGNAEPAAPPHQLMLAGSYNAPFGLFSSVQYRAVAAYAANSANTIDNWSYQVVDLRWGHDGRVAGLRLRPFFSIDNVFNQRYNSSVIVNSLGDRFFEPSPGREYAVGVTVGIGQ